MPFIRVDVSKVLSPAQKNAIIAGLGQKINCIPGKTEAALMVEICDGCTLSMGGETRDLAYLDVKIYGQTEFANQKAFAQAAYAVVADATGIPADAMYLTFSEHPYWGTNGTMK